MQINVMNIAANSYLSLHIQHKMLFLKKSKNFKKEINVQKAVWLCLLNKALPGIHDTKNILS